MQSRIGRKLDRVRAGAKPRLLDMFSGCGGFTLGFERAGFKPVAGIERDADAARSYAFNFHRDDQETHEVAEAVAVEGGDIALAQVASRTNGETDPRDSIDVITAGPPCPTFSRIGRAKLNFPHDPRKVVRETHVQRDLFMEDERNSLYHAVPEYARVLEPLAIVVENVPGFLAQRGKNHGRSLALMLEKLGYNVSYTLLNSAAYGVPQWRERFFLIALHRCVGVAVPSFPTPSHTLTGMPRGQRDARKGALRLIPHAGVNADPQLALIRTDHWVPIPSAPEGASNPITVGEAIDDLPAYYAHMKGPLRLPFKPWESSDLIPYKSLTKSQYAADMRSWPRHAAAGGLVASQQVARHTTPDTHRDLRIFREMKQGAGYSAAVEIGERLLRNEIERLEADRGPLSTSERTSLKTKYVPPYARDKFETKWQKLIGEQPSHTLTAHLSKDTYSHIHPAAEQARMITVQEAARLQSFPDGFLFRSSMSGSFRQIGNSVPPYLSFALGRRVLSELHSRPCG